MKKTSTIVLLVVISVFLLPASGQWVKNTIDENLDNPTSFYAGDIDGDGDVDLAAAMAGTSDIVWYENNNMEWTKHVIDNSLLGVGLFIADMDGNDTMDVVVAGYQTDVVRWYKNLGGSPITWSMNTIYSDLNGAEFVYVADIDKDGDPDVAATGYLADEVVWFQNGGGATSWTKYTIDDDLDAASILKVVDIDGDGALDVLAEGDNAYDVVWYKNINNGQSFYKYTIEDNLYGVRCVDTADIDRDGDLDVVAAGQTASDVVWYENDGGNPVGWTKHNIDDNLGGAFNLAIADIDMNGTLDVVATAHYLSDVVWYANNGGSPVEWSPKDTIDTDLLDAWVVTTADIDGNGTPDVFANRSSETGSIVCYLNPTAPEGGIEQATNTSSIKIYPNPVNNRLNIETEDPGVHAIKVFSISGQVIYSELMEGSALQLDVSFYEEGIYFITIRSRDQVWTEKIIKL